MSTNGTAGMRTGRLVLGYDARTASLTVQALSNPAASGAVSDDQAGMDAAVEFTGWARPICAASVQHNFRAGRHPGRCQPGRKFTR
jgi:hypothetical protein